MTTQDFKYEKYSSVAPFDRNLLPVGMWWRQHELEVYRTCAIQQLVVLDAVQLVSDVTSANINLQVQTEQVSVPINQVG